MCKHFVLLNLENKREISLASSYTSTFAFIRMIRLINISRVSCIIFLLCFLYNHSKVQKSALLCFDDSKDGIKIIATIRSSHKIESTSQFLEVNEAPCCSSPWKQCTLSNNVQLKCDNITTLLEYPFEPLQFKVRNKCFTNGFCRDGIWYYLNNFKQPTVSQSVDITLSVITSKTETEDLGEIHLNSSYPLNFGHRGALKYIARLVTPHPLVDLGPSDPVIPTDDKLLLVPEVTSTTNLEHRQIKNGSLEYLVVNRTLFSFLKEKYLSLKDPENYDLLEIIQDLNKQPFDLWTQDRIRQLLGKPTKYFLSSYGTMATNQSKRRNVISFLMDQDLMVEVTILPSNSLLQLTRQGILMSLLGTISDPFHPIVSFCNTISDSMWTCIESLISILSSLWKVLNHLHTVSSEFLGYYDDDTLKTEFWKAWDSITIICWSESYGLHLLIVLRILFVCVIAIISWSLFSPKNFQNDLHIPTAVSCPSSANGDVIVEKILPGVNNKLTDGLPNLAGTKLVSSPSETSIRSTSSDDSWTSCKSSLCQYPLRLDEVILPEEDETEDDLLDDEFNPFLLRPPFQNYCLSECSEPFVVSSLSDEDDSLTMSEGEDAYEADDEADDKPIQYWVAKKTTRNTQYEKLMMIWASEVCVLKGFFINPHWRIGHCLVPFKKIKHFDKPRVGADNHDNEPCALARLVNSQMTSDSENMPIFGHWVFSRKINPNWVFQNLWPTYTWSTSCYLPIITGTFMHGLPWRDVIYFPGGFIAPCKAVKYRTESLAYLS